MYNMEVEEGHEEGLGVIYRFEGGGGGYKAVCMKAAACMTASWRDFSI